MKKELTVGEAILKSKCPRCREGNLFIFKPMQIAKFHKMYSNCQICNQVFEPEPGFYFGAMFISYALAVAMSVTSWIFLYVLFKPAFEVYLVVILILNVVLLPFIFRYSRTLFLFGFGGIRYNKKKNNYDEE